MAHRWITIGMTLWASVALADLEPGHVINRGASEAERNAARVASDAALALGRRDFNSVLDLTSRAVGNDPWAHYVRGQALVQLGRLDDGLTELRMAEQNFPHEERWSRSIAIWGRANAFYQVGRCAEAKTAFTDYIKYVGNLDRAAVELAQKEIDGCRPPWVAPGAK